ncbi:MAG: response regulator [Cyclobacteriaceae bacterium]
MPKLKEPIESFVAMVGASKDQVVFTAYTKTIIFDIESEELKVVDAPDTGLGYHLLNKIGNDIYSYAEGILYYFNGNNWEKKKASDLINLKNGIGFLVDIGNNQALAITPDGFYDFESENKLEISKDVSDFLTTTQIYNVTCLAQKYLSISTFKGLIITDLAGQPIQFFNKNKGLANDVVLGTSLDDSGILWVATNNGISTIDLFSPVTFFDERLGIEGVITDTKIINDDLYFTSFSGVSRTKWSSLQVPFLKPKIETLTTSAAHGFIRLNNELIVLTELKPNLSITDDSISEIPGTDHAIFLKGLAYQDEKDILLGALNGLMIQLRKTNEKWTVVKAMNPMFPNISSLSLDKRNTVWVSDYNTGIYKLKYNRKSSELISERKYGKPDGLPSDFNNHLVKYENEVLFATKDGIFQYDSIKDRFVPDEKFKAVIGSQAVSQLKSDAKGNLFYFSDSFYYLEKKKEDFQKIDFPAIDFRKYIPENFSILANGQVLVSSLDAILHIDPSIKRPTHKVEVNFTSFSSTQTDSILYGGFGSIPHTTQLSYTDNSIRIGFAASAHENIKKNLFKWRLIGLEENWSSWSAEYSKDYTSLPHGSYTFEVVAKSAEGIESPSKALTFTIKTPWYFSWWAKSVYLLTSLGLFWLIVRIYTLKLVEDKKRLEEIINDRTLEITRQKNKAEQDALTIQEQNDKLLQMDVLKRRFFVNISHELRTPLTLTMGTVDQALKGAFGKLNDKLDMNLQVAYRNSERLLKMVNNILDISKLEGGTVRLYAKKYNPVKTIKKVLAFFSSRLELKNIRLIENIETTAELYLDEDKVETIIMNLLSNAFKFTPEGGQIMVTTSEDVENLFIEVTNSGESIPRADLTLVFDRFYQSPHIKSGEGMGVGLALTKELVELHGGKITVKSDQETVFTTTFKKGKSHLSPNQLLEIDQSFPSPPISDEPSPQDLLPFKSSEQHTISDKAHILLVEDNAEMSQFIVDLLSHQYTISTAHNGLKGLEFLEQQQPDLIITDYLMPKMDGYEMAEAIKRKENLSLIPIIFLTARADEQDKITVLNLGIDDYLYKPFNTEELLVRVSNLLSRNKSRKDFIVEEAMDEAAILWEEFPSNLKSKIDEFIASHIKEEITGEQLAQIANQSERSLYRKVKANTGLSPMNYVKEYRLRKARKHLELGVFNSVAEVADSVGYKYASHFTKNFKERFGKQPSEYLN